MNKKELRETRKFQRLQIKTAPKQQVNRTRK